MQKKVIFAVSALFSSFVVFGSSVSNAALTSQDASAFNGAYAGLGVSATQFDTKISTNASSTFQNYYDPDNQVLSSQTSNLLTNAYAGTAYVGYGHFFENSLLYLAGEVFTNVTNKQGGTLNSFAYHDEPNDDADHEYLKSTTVASVNNTAFGFDIKPGILLDVNTLLYGRIGGAFNKMMLSSYNLFSFNFFPDDPYNSTLISTRTKGVTGFRLGLGAEHKIANQFALTADYLWTYYGTLHSNSTGDSHSISSVDDYFINNNGLIQNSSARLSTQALELGVKYYIG